MTRHAGKALVATAVLALATGLTGCGADDDNPIADGGAATTTDEATTTTATTPSPTQYFAGGDHVGEQVTITATVAQDLTDGSIVLDGEAYGDDSLLVLFKAGEQEFSEGQSVTASGTVRQFSYDDYADDYGLAESALFDAYANEEFLAADSVAPEAAAPSS